MRARTAAGTSNLMHTAHCTPYAHSVKCVSSRQRSSKANHQFPVPTRRCQKRDGAAVQRDDEQRID